MALHVSVICLGLLLITAKFEISLSAAVPGDNEALKTVSSTVNQFSVDFYKNLAADQSENLICSPLSLSMVLSMVAFGAKGDTAKETRAALHLPSDDSVSKSGFGSLIDTLNNVKKVDLRLANKIFIAQNFEVKPEFKEITEKYFKSEIENLDFSNAPATSSVINAWGSEKTNGRIDKVITPADLQQAVMVLINAVYFKGNWLNKFEPTLTSPKPFHTDEKTTKDVPMMHMVRKFNYGVLDELDAKFIELPYAHEDEKDATSMFIILPNTVNGLSKAESNLEKVDFQQIHENPQMNRIDLSMPKFKTESSLNLQSTLDKMGLGRMFSDTADLTGIAEAPPLKISKVLQKAFIEVNEEGSEAAAVTVAVVAVRSGHFLMPPPIIFTIDKPFIYAIMHKSTNTILFQGHINEPVY